MALQHYFQQTTGHGRNGQEEKPIDDRIIYREVLCVAHDASSLLRASLILPDLDAVQREFVATRLEDLTPHWFRHSGASIAINSGAISLENASKMLGHSSPDITARMYFHRSDSQILEGMQKLGGEAFGGGKHH